MNRAIPAFLCTCFLSALLLGISACTEQNSYFYEVNPLELPSDQASKTKQKSLEQYISILYANMFQKALSADELVEIRKVMESIGDQELAREVVISNFMNRSDVIIPSDSLMRADINSFLTDTYRRFLIRVPSEAERTYLFNYINSNPDITAELVYFSFAMSEEYQFY